MYQTRLSPLTLITLIGCTGACLPAAAEVDDGWYASVNAGAVFLDSGNLAYQAPGINETAKADFDTSFSGGGTIGYRVNPDWRVEGEVMYRRNDLSDVALPNLGDFREGDFASLSFGVSALYDFNVFSNPGIRSFVGAGLVLVQEIDIDFENAGTETSFETDDIGFQLQFGARYDLGEDWFAEANVRYLDVSGVEMELPGDSSQLIKSDYSPLSVSFGLGRRF